MTLSRGYLHVSEEPHVGFLVALDLVQGSEPHVTLVTTSPPMTTLPKLMRLKQMNVDVERGEKRSGIFSSIAHSGQTTARI